MEKEKRKTRAATQRITRKKTQTGTTAPKSARKGPLAEEAVAAIAASSPPPPASAVEVAAVEVAAVEGAPEAVVAAETGPPAPAPLPLPPPLVIEITPRVTAGEDDPTTRVVFRARPVKEMHPQSWRLVRAFLRRMRSEIETRGAPFARRFPRLATVGRMLAARVGL